MHKLIIEQITIPYQKAKRTLRIYLPPGYDSGANYPVIYMHDAQNLFDVKSSSYGAIWDVHTHMNHLFTEFHKGFIVVGIDNDAGRNKRLDEYSPWVNTSIKEERLLADITTDVGGLGVQYVAFLVEILKPYIDTHYKTDPSREATAMIGSSMGGLISLYAGMKYPEIFSKIGAFSTAVWFAEKELLKMIDGFDHHYETTWYLDIGTNETSNDAKEHFNQRYLQGTLRVHDALSKHVSEERLMLVVDEGGIHNEKDWSRRFEGAITFLYKTKKNATN